MQITYISDYGSAERRHNRKTGVNRFRESAQRRTHTIVHKYIGGRIKIRTTAQQKTASASGRVSVRPPHRELSTSSLSVVLCKRFEKNDLFGNMSALYIVMEHTCGKRRRALHHLFSPRDPRTLLSPLVPRSVRIHWEYLFLLRPPLALLSQQISCHRTGANRF